MSIKTPTIHLNGTRSLDLIEDNQSVVNHLNITIQALQRARPHARDYYPQNKVGERAAYDVVVDEHCDRVRRLASVRDELVEIMASVQSQHEGRVARINRTVNEIVMTNVRKGL